jgi:hypothetical protein
MIASPLDARETVDACAASRLVLCVTARSLVAAFTRAAGQAVCFSCGLSKSRMRVIAALLFCWLAVGAGAAFAAADPVFSDTGPDAAAYGAPDYPVGSRRGAPWPQINLVGAFSHYDQLFASHSVAKAASRRCCAGRHRNWR